MRARLASMLALAVLALSGTALADGDDAADLEGLLEENVVSAPSKSAETSSSAPATSISITADDLRRYGIRTLDEAINFLSMGMVSERRFQTSEVGARGVLITSDFGSHVLLLLDGHVLSEQWGAGSYYDRGATIPVEMIDHIEIVLGPGSVLYGSNAMLGVVNVVTKRAKDFNGLRLVLESEVPVSLRGGVGFGKEFRLFGSDAELTFMAEHYEQRGPTFDYGPQNYGNDAVTGLPRRFNPDAPPGVWGGKGDDAYYTQAPTGYLRFRVGNVEAAVRAAVYKRTNPGDGGNFDDPDSYEIDRWLNVDIKHTARISRTVTLSTRLYGDLYDYRQFWTSTGAEDCLAGQDAGCFWRLLGIAMWTGIEPQLTLDWLGDRSFVTLFGVDGRYKQIKSKVSYLDNLTGDNPGDVGVYDKSEKALAVYLQQTAQPAEWMGLNAGTRIDVDDRFGSHVSPRAAILFFPWEGNTLKAIYSEAFRAPSAFEIYYEDPTTQLAGGKDLGPEVVRSVEGSVEQRFGTQKILFGVFRSWWTGLIAIDELTPQELAAGIGSGDLEAGTPYAYQAQNIASIDNYGFNAMYEGSLVSGRLRYGASVTQGFTRQDDPVSGKDVLPLAAPLFGNARISYNLGDELPTLALATHLIGRRPASNYPGPNFAKPLVELRAAISGPIPGLPELTYRLTGNYSGQTHSAYTMGPATLANGDREFTPVERFRAGIGFEYVLPM